MLEEQPLDLTKLMRRVFELGDPTLKKKYEVVEVGDKPLPGNALSAEISETYIDENGTFVVRKKRMGFFDDSGHPTLEGIPVSRCYQGHTVRHDLIKHCFWCGVPICIRCWGKKDEYYYCYECEPRAKFFFFRQSIKRLLLGEGRK